MRDSETISPGAAAHRIAGARVLHRWAADILGEVRARWGDEVGAHLHPWNTPPLDDPFLPHNTVLKNLPGALQRAKLEHLTALLTQAVGARPRCFRAGRFGLGVE